MNFQSYLWIVSLSLMVSLLWGCRGDLDEKLGCTDPRSLNYDPGAVFDSGDCDYSDSYKYLMPEFWSDSDTTGNLMVVNQTESPLHLYVDENQTHRHLAVVPPKHDGFQVDVPIKSETTVLKLWRAEDVDYVEDVPMDKVFKSWRVVGLQPSASDIDPQVWGVNNQEIGEGDGKVYIYYTDEGEDENQLPCNVDIFLYSKEGGRITSVAPGTVGKVVYLTFGNYVFWYRYWVSDPSSSDGYRVLGWKKSDDIVLNANRSMKDVDLPQFDIIPPNAAGLEVVNRVDETIHVLLNNRLIENLVMGRENTMGMSSIEDRDSITYPLEANRYNLSFINGKGQQVGNGFYVDLHEFMTARIVAGQERKALTVKNTTDLKLFLGDDDYLGVSVKAAATKDVTIPKELESVNVFSSDSTFFKRIKIESESLNID
jgi:hypothetical protein